MRPLFQLLATWLLAAPVVAHAQDACSPYTVPDHDFQYKIDDAYVNIQWHEGWTREHGESLPAPLPRHEVWQHPLLNPDLPGTMHEDSMATDTTNRAGPVPYGAELDYFHVLETKQRFSGMAPFFTFLDEDTLLTISFGRDAGTALLIDVSDEPVLLDSVDLPGRGSSALSLASDKGRMKMFRDTSGGAYSYVTKKGYLFVPGADNFVMRIPIRDRKFDKDNMVHLDLTREVAVGTLTDVRKRKADDNRLTAIFPDADGNVWFTTRIGILGVILNTDAACPTVVATHLSTFALKEKVEQVWGVQSDEMDEIIAKAENARLGEIPELRDRGREIIGIDDDIKEEVQNSFAVGPDGVYVVSNLALYKFQYDAAARRIVLDPKWEPTYAKGELLYDNDFLIKPGHLNTGSGTSPTLVDDRFVVIDDNAPDHTNLLVFRQDTGELVDKLPMFGELRGGAVENSVVAYKDSLVVGNTYGYVDPFEENPTVGGLMRFDYNHATGHYEPVKNWPIVGHIDAKTATPKLSTPHGLIYIYHRKDEEVQGHSDWQLTAIDFRTGQPVFSLHPEFKDTGIFDDNVSEMIRKAALGKGAYERKVFNNIWGTYAIGPDQSLYIGAYRGFLRFRSGDPPAPVTPADTPVEAEPPSEPNP